MIHNSNTNKKECMRNYVIFNTQQIKVNSNIYLSEIETQIYKDIKTERYRDKEHIVHRDRV